MTAAPSDMSLHLAVATALSTIVTLPAHIVAFMISDDTIISISSSINPGLCVSSTAVVWFGKPLDYIIAENFSSSHLNASSTLCAPGSPNHEIVIRFKWMSLQSSLLSSSPSWRCHAVWMDATSVTHFSNVSIMSLTSRLRGCRDMTRRCWRKSKDTKTFSLSSPFQHVPKSTHVGPSGAKGLPCDSP